ncbi:MAG TPA: hypothetical protein DHU96_17220 [Actinobacteria bacterium]|nr:hypothetical protein [Actinomycetota bacterium]
MVDRARRTIETEGFASLYLRCPEVRLRGTDRVAAAMRAFVAGDALGVPWEGGPPENVDHGRLFELPASHGWPQGATSDDTAQMMLVSRLLADTSGRPTTGEFMRRLSDAAAGIRGTGRPPGRRWRASPRRASCRSRLPIPATEPPTGRPCGWRRWAGSSRPPTRTGGARWCASWPGGPIPRRSRSALPA